MDATTIAAAEAYKGTASIIQGILIALSAIIAVVGYRVQASLARKQHVRESALNDTKQLLKELVGPAQGYAYLIDYMWLNFMCNVVWKDDDTVGKDDWRGAFSKVTGDPDAITSFMKGKAYMHMSSFVGKEKEEEIKQNPTGYLAIEYRRFVRRAVIRGVVALKLKSTSVSVVTVAASSCAAAALRVRRVQVLARFLVRQFYGQGNFRFRRSRVNRASVQVSVIRVPVTRILHVEHLTKNLAASREEILHRHHLGVVRVVAREC